MNVAAHILVTGRVQGVGYRYFAMRNASQLGLTGYVRNLSGGSVELLTEGEKELIQHFIEILKKGPGFSRVEQVKVTYKEYSSKYSQFSVDY
ncbi:MAG: acylphosphatase [Calditrichales bacterium]|nr:MAG: acylphosphatase [Calditrichales bacterium]